MKYINIIIIVILVSCSQDESSSSNQSQSRGEIIADLDLYLEFYRELDKKYPGPKFPGFDNQYKVIKANRYGLLELEDGRFVSLAGLECDHQDLKKYLDSLVEYEDIKIVFIPTGFEVDNQIFAYVWEVETPDPSSSGFEFGTTISPLASTFLASQWCKPMDHDKHKYHQRYIKIAEQSH